MLELLILLVLAPKLALRFRMETLNAPQPPQERRRRRPRPRLRPLHTPRISDPSAIITPSLIESLHQHLPTRFQITDWQSVYSTTRHGISLQTFFRKASDVEPVILLIKDSGGAVFGYYSTVGWKKSEQYYGTGESFVFSLVPEMRVYKWTRVNKYHQLASNSIAVGGGGKFAIFMDGMLERGSSGLCQTYGSPCLASSEDFDVVVVEAYRLVPPYKLQMGK